METHRFADELREELVLFIDEAEFGAIETTAEIDAFISFDPRELVAERWVTVTSTALGEEAGV